MSNSLEYLKKAFCWLFSNGPAGVGSLAVGIAALITVCKTNGILDEVKLIREDAKHIRRIIYDQKSSQSKSIVQAIEAGTPVKKALSYFKNEATAFPGDLYLPSDALRNLEISIESKSLSKEAKQKEIADALSFKRE